MTPAELKTLRESLGLTVQWLADAAKVTHRSASYWEAGKVPVPADVAELILAVEEKIQRAVDEAVKQVNLLSVSAGIPDEIAILRYKTDADLHRYRPDFAGLPTTCHAAMLARIKRELSLMGLKIMIVYFDETKYLTWLADRPDNEARRAEWAAKQ